MDDYIKLVMLGEGRVGKTSLTLRYTQGIFDDNQISTINASYLEKDIIMKNGIKKKLAIWDTAGQEKFNALAPMYYRDALGAIIVYDITFKESFDKVNKWISELRQFADSKIVVCIAGNKSDNENMRQIQKQMAEKYAQDLGCVHFSTSAKANQGVDDMFKFITESIVEKQSVKKGGKKKTRNLLTNANDFNNDDDGNSSPTGNGNGNGNFGSSSQQDSSSSSSKPVKATKLKITKDDPSTNGKKKKDNCC